MCGCRNRRRSSFVIVCDCKRFDNVPMKVHRPDEDERCCCDRIVEQLEDINESLDRFGRRNRRNRRNGCGFCNFFRGFGNNCC